MSGFFDIYSIIFLVIAVVIFMRLGSVLGRRTGNEPTSYDGPIRPAPSPSRNDNVVTLPSRERPSAPEAVTSAEVERLGRHAPEGTVLHQKLVEIARASAGFDPDHFLAGAKAAYEMIVLAYAEGDRATLRNLLAPEVLESFTGAISEREARQERTETTFVGIEEAKITAADLVEGRFARVSVRFVASLISVTRDKAGTVVDGDPTEVQTIRDIWTFSRDVDARDPNWKLVATEPA
ncbi:Tim44/TimA family putative adaptor protein [Propylenella binzhouense]|uniref:Tim44/TimA family putative adaptor protein n=1 Tax=Propylenella binzhouense TaxID=2555902 RepID=A0A964WSB8_9HYPH|nr:Tim44/TimA family putative adaptor protein [Propylenella binzhouense]MYZ46818.1 Tim44/TimA family putative adaptor protein [Propylenella binzhouense]